MNQECLARATDPQLTRRLLQTSGTSESRRPPLLRLDRDKDLPLSFAQQRLWLVDQLGTGSAAYNMPFGLRLNGELDQTALHWSLSEIVKRHEVLRTTFPVHAESPVQRIAAETEVVLEELDLGDIPEAERDTEVARLAREEARRVFDLSTGPLLRFKLLRLADCQRVLLVNMHHIISDGSSIRIMLSELSRLYQAYRSGEKAVLNELKIQYADFAVWQREWLRGEVLEKQTGYWRRQLDRLATLELPTDRPRSKMMGHSGANVFFQVPSKLAGQLNELCKRERATLFMTLLTAFQALLYRYTGQEDIAVGSPFGGRTRMEIEGLIGFFVNMLVLRAKICGALSFTELLRQVKDVALEAYMHQDLPFEKVVEALSPQRESGRTPLFRVWFALQNVPRPDFRLGPIKMQPFNIETGIAKFDLGLSLSVTGTGLAGVFEYDGGLFYPASITRMAEHYSVFLTSIVAEPHRRISELPLQTEAERQRALVGWNQIKSECPRQCVHELIYNQVGAKPTSVAVEHESEQLSYLDLNRRANQLAHYLRRKLGVLLGARVGICIERPIELVIAMLAVLKSGSVIVPIDPTGRLVRGEFILKDAAISVLVTEERLGERFCQKELQVLNLGRDREEVAKENAGEVKVDVPPDSLACVLYRATPNGSPAGVLVKHQALGPKDFGSELNIISSDRIAMTLSLSDEDICFKIFSVLAVGAHVVDMTSRPPLPPGKLARALCDHAATVLFISAPELGHLAREFPWALRMLRLILCEDRPTVIDRLRRTLKPDVLVRVHGLYGWSEIGGYRVARSLAETDGRASLEPILRLAAGMNFYLLDGHLDPVPQGFVGEIYLGGETLSSGYNRQPAETAKTFVPNPFATVPGSRLYRTLDLAHLRADGSLEHHGRSNGQLLMGGVRIELNEIEEILGRHPSVREAAVVVSDTPGVLVPGVIAFVAPTAGRPPTAETLQHFLQERLPETVLPVTFTFVETIARTPDGTVDRGELAKVAKMNHSSGARSYVAARNAIEERLTCLWTGILDARQVGIHDNFFDRGGNSLQATQLLARISDAFQMDFPVHRFFEAPTICALGKIIEQSARRVEPPERSSSPILVGLQREGCGIPFFCVHPAGGSVLYYGELSSALGRARPFYGLQSLASDDGQNLVMKIEQMAEVYNAEIEQVQRDGPYLLGGWSMGGLVAFEMARQLRHKGKPVGLLSLFDTYPPRHNRAATEEHNRLSMLTKFASDMSRMHGKTCDDLLERLVGLGPEQQRLVIFDVLKRNGVPRANAPQEELNDLLNVFAHNYLAVERYSLQRSEQRIVLFRAAEVEEPESLAREWVTWAGAGLDVHVVPGNHHSMLKRPHVSATAELLMRYLDEAQERAMLQVSGSVDGRIAR
jgi:non-ribosomal peptide synthetase component F/thioesterase domain-containing protein